MPTTEAQRALWNAIMPKRIARLRILADHVAVLHPTKGWRFVAKRRLGLA